MKARNPAVWLLAGLALTSNSSGAALELESRASSGYQAYWVEQVAEGLNFPSSLVWLPNGDMLITERMGDLRIVRAGKLDSEPVRGVPASYHSLVDGLKDIALDPDYKANQTLYLFIAEGTFEERHAAVYRARYGAQGLTNVQRIFRSNEGVGGIGGIVTIAARMVFLADKTLLLAVAEDHAHPRAQQLNSHMGKVLRINRDGSIPPDNPFLNTPEALPEIWSYGHRVPLGLYQDETGMIWEVEAGPRGGDELNLLKAGGNYGWATASWGFAYNNRGLEAPRQSRIGIEDPILIWMPSATPSGLTRYHGRTYPAWDGDYFAGQLSGKALERLRIVDRHVVLQEKLLWDFNERIRDVKVGPDNRLYLLTDHSNGRVVRLQPGRPRAGQLPRVARKLEQAFIPGIEELSESKEPVKTNLTPYDEVQAKQAFLQRCAICHSVGEVVRGGQMGPDLAGAYGRPMGRETGFDYSPNMQGGLLPWTFTTLDRFLADPGAVVPGTTMAISPVSDPETRRQIIGFLRMHSAKPE